MVDIGVDYAIPIPPLLLAYQLWGWEETDSIPSFWVVALIETWSLPHIWVCTPGLSPSVLGIPLATGVMKVKPRRMLDDWRKKSPFSQIVWGSWNCFSILLLNGKEPETKADTNRRVNPRLNKTKLDSWSNYAWSPLHHWVFSVTWVYTVHLLFSVFRFGFSVTRHPKHASWYIEMLFNWL